MSSSTLSPHVAAQTGPSAYLGLVRKRKLYGTLLTLLLALMLFGGFNIAESRNAGGFLSGLPMVFAFPAEVISEAWEKRANILPEMANHLPALIETLNTALVATLLGAVAAAFLAPLATRGLAPFPAAMVVLRRMLDACRAVPEIVIALVLIYILGNGPVPAVVAIAIHTAGALGKLFSEAGENADLKPIEGLTSVGAPWVDRIALGLLPQVAPNWLSYALLRLEINLRASAILGFVGAGGIGYDLKIAMQWGQGRYDLVVAIFLLLFLSIAVIDRLSDHLRARLVKG